MKKVESSAWEPDDFLNNLQNATLQKLVSDGFYTVTFTLNAHEDTDSPCSLMAVQCGSVQCAWSTLKTGCRHCEAVAVAVAAKAAGLAAAVAGSAGNRGPPGT